MRQIIAVGLATIILAGCDQNTPPAPEAAAPVEATDTADQPVADVPADQAGGTPASADLAPIIGRWSYDGAACTGPIEITASSFQGAEYSCTFDSVSVGEDGTVTADMSCSGQGETATERLAMTPIFGPAGEGIRLDYLDREGDPVPVFRCTR